MCVRLLLTPTLLSSDKGPYATKIRCDACNLPRCQLICRAIGCQSAFHARCFTIDQKRWPSVMNEGDGLHLRDNDDVLGSFVCPSCVVDFVYTNRAPPSDSTRAAAVELERTRQFMFFHARSSASTVNGIASSVKRIRRFEGAMGLPVTPAPYTGDYEPLALGWYFMARASEVKVQSLSTDRSAVSALFDAGTTLRGDGVLNPLLSSAGGAHSARASRSLLGASLLGLSHVLGEEVVSTGRLTLRVVLAVQVYCIERAYCTPSTEMRLFFINTALYAVLCTMGLYRPNELSLCYLKGMFDHFFVGERQHIHGLAQPHVGTLFGKPAIVSGTRRTVGAITKVNRKGQKFDADGYGSDSVVCAQTRDIINRPVGGAGWMFGRTVRPGERHFPSPLPGGGGSDPRLVQEFVAGDWRYRLSPSYLMARVFELRGVSPYQLVWPKDVSTSARLFESADGKPIFSSRGQHPFLPRLRAVLVVLQTSGLENDRLGLEDLRDVQVNKLGNYWLKITGLSTMQARGVPEEMRTGAGRWRLLSKRPGSMAVYYVQSTLEQKLQVSDFGGRWVHSD